MSLRSPRTRQRTPYQARIATAQPDPDMMRRPADLAGRFACAPTRHRAISDGRNAKPFEKTADLPGARIREIGEMIPAQTYAESAFCADITRRTERPKMMKGETAMSDILRVFEKRPYDARLTADRHTSTVFPITRFSSREEIEKRREELVFSLRMAAGLYPWPEKTPMQVRREVCARYPGCTVEKIMFETRPGFWSTGNLYLPDPLNAPAPAILNVIGHWQDQRLTRLEEADYPQQLVNFARMGFVCLVTDMIGKVDSRQISHEYGGGEKELWCSNGLGVQLWNNIRALDLLCGMPETDGSRIGVTGASGGGSQSLFLAMADDRIKACAPINMISLRMQGGCFCENAPGLRRDTDNAEMCAMLAPRPLFLAGSTGDWTDQLMTQEYPAMLETYRRYGAEDHVEVFYQVADHQYNKKTRRRVYNFFARHLMGQDIQWTEQDIETDDIQDLTWFRGSGSAPGLQGDQAFYHLFHMLSSEEIYTLLIILYNTIRMNSSTFPRRFAVFCRQRVQ